MDNPEKSVKLCTQDKGCVSYKTHHVIHSQIHITGEIGNRGVQRWGGFL